MRPDRSLALVVLLLAGCAGNSFDRAYQQGRWADAALVIAADTTRPPSEARLYRTAILHSTPGAGMLDHQVSHEALAELLQRYPSSEDAPEARRMLGLLDELEASSRAAGEARAAIDTLLMELARLSGSVDDLRARVDQQRDLAVGIEESLRVREEEVRALRDELDRLKAVDLRPAPRKGRSDP